MKRLRRTQALIPSGDRGMTLIELMIVLGILSLASSAMFSLLFASFRVYWKGDLATQVQQGARISIDRMDRDLRQAGKVLNGVTRTAGATSVTFDTACSPSPTQISVELPHLASVPLTPTGSIYATDANAAGTTPYEGWDVSYYLAAASNSATPNAAGPYLIRASYDVVGNTITLATVADNITALALNSAGSCPTAATREFTITLTSYQIATGTGVTSQTIVTDDVALRNTLP